MKYEFRAGQRSAWLEWVMEMKRREKEILETLRNEGVASEACFISEDGKFLFYYLEADDFGKARRAVTENPLPIDIEHQRALQDFLRPIAAQECLFDFQMHRTDFQRRSDVA